jgi:hypothetical protein
MGCAVGGTSEEWWLYVCMPCVHVEEALDGVCLAAAAAVSEGGEEIVSQFSWVVP